MWFGEFKRSNSFPHSISKLVTASSSHCYRLAAIIEATGAAAYHGFLPSMVRDCVAMFTSTDNPAILEESEFPLSFATALFSFLYHLATYEASKFLLDVLLALTLALATFEASKFLLPLALATYEGSKFLLPLPLATYEASKFLLPLPLTTYEASKFFII